MDKCIKFVKNKLKYWNANKMTRKERRLLKRVICYITAILPVKIHCWSLARQIVFPKDCAKSAPRTWLKCLLHNASLSLKTKGMY